MGSVGVAGLGGTRCQAFVTHCKGLLTNNKNSSRSPSRVDFSPGSPLNVPRRLHATFTASFTLLASTIGRSSTDRRATRVSTLSGRESSLLVFVASAVARVAGDPLTTRHATTRGLCLPMGPCVKTTHLTGLRRATTVRNLLMSLSGTKVPRTLTTVGLARMMTTLGRGGGRCTALARRHTGTGTSSPMRDTGGVHLHVSRRCSRVSACTFTRDIIGPARRATTFVGHLGTLISRAGTLCGRHVTRTETTTTGGRRNSGPTASDSSPSRVWGGRSLFHWVVGLTFSATKFPVRQ